MTQRRHFLSFLAALPVAVLAGVASASDSAPRVEREFAEGMSTGIWADSDPASTAMPRYQLVAANCSQAAADAAAQTRGRVLTVSSRNQDGRTVCVVTVLVPAEGGGRPRKKTVVVPQ